MSEPKSKATKFWDHPYTGRVLCLIAFGVSIWLACQPQVPGVAIGVLGTAAAIMSIQKLSARGKFIWTFIIFILLIAEIRAIHSDRRAQNAQFNAERKALNNQFQAIRDRENADFNATVGKLQNSLDTSEKQFRNTMQQLKRTLTTTQDALKSAKAAEQNTVPRADIEMRAILSNRQLFPSGQHASLTANDFIGQKTLNVEYINTGSAEANDFWLLGRFYPGVPGSLTEQIRISSEFQHDWQSHKMHSVISLSPSTNTMSGPIFSPGLSNGQLENFQHGKLAIYYFVRFAYTDKTGEWYRDNCGWFDYSETTIVWSSPCSVIQPSRYPAPKQ